MFRGDRLRQVRELRGLTQVALSEAVPGLTQYQVSRLERGDATPDGEVRALLAVNLGVTEAFFARPPDAGVEISTPQLRARSRLPKRTQYAAIEWGRVVLERYAEAARGLELPPQRLGEVGAGDPAEAARAVRGLMGVAPDAPIGALVLAVERLGVAVAGIPFQDDGIDAFCAWRGGTPSVVVLRDAPGDRLRFSVAHELGHLVLHRDERRTGKDLEAQADEFAARLLTPPEGLLRDLPPHPTLAALTMVKTKWGVSVKSLIRRCRELGVVDADRAVGLYRQISARGWNKREPGFVAREKPRGFRKVCELRYGEVGTVVRLAEEAGWSLSMAQEVWEQHAGPDELPFVHHSPASLRAANVVSLHRRQRD